MHGTVDTVIQQSVTTYKQYENGVLISADLTESSLIKGASQFCYLKEKDRVIWRKPASKNYNGLDTEWKTGAPYNIMTIGGEHGFKATNGLPAYELSVYVIEEDTVASTSPVTPTEDGKFKITYELKPETWQEEVDGVLTTKGATAYYINQMIFTGGLTTPPEFNAISVTFTFDENWQVFQTDIEEKYSAKYGPIAAPCVSTSTTRYEYNTEKAHSDAYEEYFYQYAEGEANNAPVVKEITALDCLAEGFGSVLTEPTVLDLDLTVGDTPYRGTVDLDLSQTDFAAFDPTKLAAKVKLGPLSLWVEEGNAYLNYGGLKFAVKLDELISLVKDLTQEAEPDVQAEEGDDLLSALGSGDFTLADGKAELHSVLPLLGLNIPVDFYFSIGENNEISVEKVTATVSLGDTLSIGAQLGFGSDHLPALGASQKTEYVPLMPYVNKLIGLFSSDVLHADISYMGEGIALSGGFDLRIKELALAGRLQVDVSLDGVELSKTVGLSFTDGTFYLDLDGVKVQATLEEDIALLEQYVALPELPDEGALSGFDLGALINTLLSDEFAALFSSSEENGLLLAVKGSELLSAFGVNFALGDVKIAVGDGLSATALGAEIDLTAGTDVTLDTDGYTSVLPYVQTLIDLFSHENLLISVSYAGGGFTAAGEIMLNLASQTAVGEIVLGYQNAEKTLSVIYEGGSVYLDVEGLRIKAGVNEAAALVSSLTGAESDLDAKALINKVLALDFGSVITLGEENDTLTVLLKGTELLNALGVEFDLQTVTLSVDSESVKAEALGAVITVKAGSPFTVETAGYIDIIDYASTIATMIKRGYLSAEVSYTAGDLSVSGKIELALNSLAVKAALTLKYGSAKQDINIIYGENTVYLEVGGMKISANINEAIALIGPFVNIPAGDTAATDLIEELLSLDFEEVFTLTEKGDTLSLAIAGTELLNALGVEFELDTITLSINGDSVTAQALGATITIKQGAPFETDTDHYIDIVDYASTIATMIKSGYLSADVSYNAGNLSVSGKIELALNSLAVKAALTLKYGSASQDISIVYGAGVVYLELGGMKLSANINEAVALIGQFVNIPAGDTEATDLIEALLSLDFKEVFTLTEKGDTLSLAIAGTELLSALGVEFDLKTVTLSVDSESVKAEALGAVITVKAGAEFTVETAGYIGIVDYASTIATMIKSGYLSADVSYTAGDLSVSGNLQIALETLKVKASLTLEYGSAKQDINIIYGENTVYLEVGGMKLSADVNKAIALIGQFVNIPAGDTEATDLIEGLLSLDFEEVFTLTEKGDTLSLAIAGTELLNALGVEFELQTVTLSVNSESVKAEALGATITIKQGAPFETDTDHYIDIMDYANTIATMIKSGYLSAEVTYTAGDLSVSGNLQIALETLQVQGGLTLTYGTASQDIHIIYCENTVYVEVGGMKLSADVNKAIALIGQFANISAGNSEERDLLKSLLSLNFEEVFTLTEKGDTLSLAIAGTELLNALGVEFDLQTVTLSVDSESVKAEALGAVITVKAGKPFTVDTTGYINVVYYASKIANMIKSGYLSADVTYNASNLSVTGNLQIALETLQVQGSLTLTYGTASKDIHIIYDENTVYLEVDGMKLSADVNKAIALIGQFPTGNSEEKDLLKSLLSLDFEKVFTLKENGNTLLLVIAGTELLNALGVKFKLGQVTLAVDSESVTAEALGAVITVKAGKPFDVETTGYIDIIDYASTVANMIKSGYLSADVSYTADDLSVSGNLQIALEKTLQVQGNLTLTYGTASKDINIIYGAGVVYLEADGMKFSADVDKAIALIGQFVNIPTVDTEATGLIETLLSLNFEKVFTLTEKGNTLSLAIAGTELLNALGVKFKLGQVTLAVDSDSVTAEALGAVITIKQGASFETNTDNYIGIVDYASTIATMIKSGYLSADVTYTAGDLIVTGTVALGIDPLKAGAQLALKYGEDALKQIGIVYAEDGLYLTVYDGNPAESLKVSLDAKKAVALVTSLVGASGDTKAEALIEKLLSVDLKTLIPVFQEVQRSYVSEEGEVSEENILQLTVAGNELLSALGVEFKLGNVEVEITQTGITAKVLGAEITVKSGSDFSVATEGYLDLTPLFENVATVLTDKALALSGDVVLTLNDDFEIDVEIENAVLSFEKGIMFRLHAFIYLQKQVKLEVFLGYDNGTVRLACGALGAEIVISELGSLKEALLDVYGDLYSIVGDMLVDKSKNPLPAPEDFEKTLNGTSGDGEPAAPVWTEIVKALAFQTRQTDILATYGDLIARLFFPSANGFLGVELSGSLGNSALKLDGMLHLKNAPYSGKDETGKNIVEFPEMPEITYLGTEEFKAFIGYLGSAVDLLNTKDLTLTFSGKVTSTDKEAYPPAEGEEFGTKYTIEASMSTHRGQSNLIHLDVDGNNLWVDTDVFAHASINIKATHEADNSLYIDLFILDGAAEKDAEGNTVLDEAGKVKYKTDNMLDFYVTLSQFGPADSTAETVAGYNPVRLYAPSDEILTILSSALPMFGIDVEILNNYMISKWLSLENVAQLKAFGDLVSPLLSGLLGAKETSEEPADTTEPADSADTAEPETPAEPLLIKDYLKGLTVTAEELSIELNSEKLYGIAGLQNVTATLQKEADTEDEKGYHYGNFTSLDLFNIYDKTGKLNTSLQGTIDYNVVTPDVPSGEYQSFLGAEKLILAIAKSATHGVNEAGEQTDKIISGEETPHHYVVNNNFYIDGTATIKLHLGGLKLTDITINVIAISVTVDENGELGINIRLAYEGSRAVVTLINGSSTVDITIKGGMVYMKRVQTSYYKTATLLDWSSGWTDYDTPITLYRVAPLSSFTADILDHIGFILNFGDTVTNALSSAIGSGSGSTSSTAVKVDFGKRLSDVLSAYSFTAEQKNEQGEITKPASWDLTLNGDALVKGVLGDLHVTIAENTNGYIHDITASTSVVSIIDATVTLHWRNPGGSMEDGVTDQTHDIIKEDNLDDKASGFGGMTEKLFAQGWGTEDYIGFATFLEGQRQTVTFKHHGTEGEETLGTQEVIASTGADGNSANTLYSALGYPDVSAEKYAPADPTQVMGWAEVDPGETLSGDYVVWTMAHGRPLEVTFRSKTELGNNWLYDEAEDDWYYKVDMWYGAQITFGNTTETVTDDKTVFDLDDYPVPDFTFGTRDGHWQKNPEIDLDGATFVAEYDPDRIVYRSDVAFTVKGVIKNAYELTVDYGTDHTVYEPTAKGYTFVGWYEQREDGSWTKVNVGAKYELGADHKETTLEALWVSNLTVTLTKTEKSNERVEGGRDIPFVGHVGGTTYCDYAMEAVLSGGKLVGAFADQVTLELTYSFEAFTERAVLGDIVRAIGTKTTTGEYPPEGVISAQQERVEPADTPRAHVQIKYTYNGATLYDTSDIVITGEWVEAT